ncbi:MAG: LuxR C-terminal-related transcriptional regulator [Chloroflexota bacterium]
MLGDLLQTKLHVPRLRPSLVPRPHLIETINQSLTGKLTLISAPAGFGKTTLISSWIHHLQLTIDDLRLAGSQKVTDANLQSTIHNRIAWLSLDENDGEPARFLAYVIAALQQVDPKMGASALPLLQASPLPVSSVLTTLLNDVSQQKESLMLVLDDYHAVDSQPVDEALTFLLDNLPPQLHLVITSREDPNLPLARLRVRGLLAELRASDLRFTVAETAVFLQQVMGLNLTEDQIAALETRTEGWIAGLQMAALAMQRPLSMRGQADVSGFIQSFTGSHRFVLDYLLEEVLHQQPEHVQEFLLKTAVLTRLTGSLCDALTGDDDGQEMLESLDRANLFLVPLDNERRWYRYHHLFAELLQQRLLQETEKFDFPELHIRASMWYEDNGLELDAFHHAAAANDIDRTERLIEGDGMPLHYRGAAFPVLHWLASLPTTLLDARPSLWVTYASVLLFGGQHPAVEQKLQAAESCLQSIEPDDKNRDLVGRIASMRATLAIIHHDVEAIMTQSRRALTHLHPGNLLIRTAANWMLGFAYHLQGDRAAASQAYAEVISISKSFENSIYGIAATTSLGQLQLGNNQLALAQKTFERALKLAGDPSRLINCEAFLGLARIHYQWNDLETAHQYGQQCAQLTQQQEGIDTFAAYGVFLARLKLVQGDVSGASAALDEAEAYVRQHNFLFRLPDVVAAQVRTLLRQGNLTAAAHLAEKHDLPLSRARICLAQGDTRGALALLAPLRQQMEAKGWHDEHLKIMILQALVLQADGEKNEAVQLLGDALALAEANGFIRIFVDEGLPMAQLLAETAVRGIMPSYCEKLLAVFAAEGHPIETETFPASAQSLVDPLTKREMEILSLIATGLKNKEIAAALFVSVNTVHYHTKNLYSKLGANSRTQAITRAKALNLLA